MSKAYQYLFGPVPSRRLGRSLGVDLIPFKTCTMNCSFCQLGETACAISERGDYIPMQDVLAELTTWQVSGGTADHITLAGSGEPTLHVHFGDVFKWVREHTKTKSVLLTNGSLLHFPDVRRDAVLADKVKVTLSAWDEASFQKIHRPADGVNFELLVKGEQVFREEFKGELSVEVFIVEGVNSRHEEVQNIARVVETIQPDRIDINTAVRPPADPSVRSVSKDYLETLAQIFGPKAAVTASFKKEGFASLEISDEALVGLIKRHPATCGQLADEFNLPEDQMYKTLKNLMSVGLLSAEERGGQVYYCHCEV